MPAARLPRRPAGPPRSAHGPLTVLGWSWGAIALTLFVVLVAYLGRDGYGTRRPTTASACSTACTTRRVDHDDRLRRHRAGQRRGAAGDAVPRHPGADPVPHTPRRHHGRAAGRAVAPGDQAAVLESTLEGPRHRLRIRNEGPHGRRGAAQAGRRPRSDRRDRPAPGRARAGGRGGPGGDRRRRVERRRPAPGRDRDGARRRCRPRPRRHRRPDHADRAGAQPDGHDQRRRARGGERPPAAPERRDHGDHLVGRRRPAGAWPRRRRGRSRCWRTCCRSARGSTWSSTTSARKTPDRAATSSATTCWSAWSAAATCCASTTRAPPSSSRATASSACAATRIA